MAPNKRPDSDLAQQDVLQAVVLADSFAENFRPITFERPKMLLPLANVPMIEYTLEFLAAGGVQEVFVFCCSHSEEVQRYIKETELERRLATLRLHVLVAAGNCYSVGDALRQVEARGVITSDFVLVPGDVVSNLQLAPLITQHKARRELDKDAVLTTIMKKIPPQHRSRRAGEEKLVALTGETGRLLLYEDVAKRRSEHKLRLPTSLLTETDQLELFTDLYDTHIDICVPELLTLLQATAVPDFLARLPRQTASPDFLARLPCQLPACPRKATRAHALAVHQPRRAVTHFGLVRRDPLWPRTRRRTTLTGKTCAETSCRACLANSRCWARPSTRTW